MNDLPAWYWKHGLHDAQVLQQKEQQLEYDYSQKNPKRNCLELTLDSKGALFDSRVKAIRFYNYKIIACEKDLSGTWWIGDTLQKDGDKFILTIQAEFLDSNSKSLKTTFVIKFDFAEVETA